AFTADELARPPPHGRVADMILSLLPSLPLAPSLDDVDARLAATGRQLQEVARLAPAAFVDLVHVATLGERSGLIAHLEASLRLTESPLPAWEDDVNAMIARAVDAMQRPTPPPYDLPASSTDP